MGARGQYPHGSYLRHRRRRRRRRHRRHVLRFVDD